MHDKNMKIAGIGVVSGYGWGAHDLWSGRISGKPAANLCDGYGRNGDEQAWLARVPAGGDLADGASRSARAMRAAAREAITDAEQRGWTPGRRVGVLHALVLPEIEEWRSFYVVDHGRRRSRDYLNLMPSTPMSL